MGNVLLGVTGSVAAIRTPELFAALHQRGFDIKVVATRSATYFFDPLAIAPHPSDPAIRNRSIMILDEDEWPGDRYRRGDEVLHIELRRWADLLVIAPLDANTLAKLAFGLSDNCLTCVWRAWDPSRPIVLAPAMNTLMWQHPITRLHLRQIAEVVGVGKRPESDDAETTITAINEQSPTLRIIPPQVKQLACGDTGIGAMAEIAAIVEVVQQSWARAARRTEGVQ